jgi:alpha-1,3-glucosyltransferase
VDCHSHRVVTGLRTATVGYSTKTLIALAESLSFVDSSPGTTKRAAQAAALSILLSPGLLIIDHIHFQYNGAMYGVMIMSVVLARSKSTLLGSGLIFAALLCLKHIYLYLAPAYFVYLLRAYCLSPKSIFHIQWLNCVKLGGGIALIFAAAFGPFALMGQIPQILSRLFPFSRGLCHAYWAPNVWAIYSFSDRVLIYGGLLFDLSDCRVLMAQSSCATIGPAYQAGSSEQRNSRTSGRHVVRGPP